MRLHTLTRRDTLMGLAASLAAAAAPRSWAAVTAAPNAAAAGNIVIGDLTVHRLGLGAMRITGEGMWGMPTDPRQARQVLRRAVQLGVNLIDTADAYGPDVSEQLIYDALHPYPPGLVIATKGGETRPSASAWVPDGSPKHLRAACEGSLKRLHLQRIDLYQLHTPDPKVPIADSLGELARLQQEGKIRHIGVSNFSLAQLQQARKQVKVVSVQNRYNVNDRDSEDVLQYCAHEGLAFLPWAPLGHGPGPARAEPSDAAIAQIARARGVSAQQVALAWLLQRSKAMLPIPGTSSPQHLEDNIAAVNLRLTTQELQQLG